MADVADAEKSVDIPGSKSSLRPLLLARRAAILPAQRLAYQEALAQELFARICQLDLAKDKSKAFIGFYSAFGTELSLESLIECLRNEGFKLAFPVVANKEDMVFAKDENTAAMAQVKANPAKALAAEALATLAIVAPADLALVIVPGAGFDKEGYRLGYGGGYYDRYLPKLSDETLVWGVAFPEQLVDSFEHETYDVLVKEVIVL